MAGENVLFAVVAGTLLAVGNNLARIGVVKGDPIAGSAVSVFVGTPVLFVAAVLSGSLAQLAKLGELSFLYLAISGVLGFVGGRSVVFVGAKMIGTSRTQVVMSSSIVYTVILGMVILGETLSLREAIGVVSMTSGVIIISTSGSDGSKSSTAKSFIIGFGVALLGAIFVATSSILAALGLAGKVSPVAGVLVSYASAALVWAVFVMTNRKMLKLIREPSSLKLFSAQGFVVSLAQLSRYFALSLGPVILVQPINNSVNPVLTILLAYVFLQRMEHVNLKVWVSAALVIIGTFLATG